jgi:hypothetical protein
MGGQSKYRKFAEAFRELAVRRLMDAENVSEGAAMKFLVPLERLLPPA